MLELELPTDAMEYFFLKEENQYWIYIVELERHFGSYNIEVRMTRLLTNFTDSGALSLRIDVADPSLTFVL